MSPKANEKSDLDVLPNGKLSDVQLRLGQKMEVYKLKLAKVDPCAVNDAAEMPRQ